MNVEELKVDETYKILANNYVFKGRFKGFRYLNGTRAVMDSPDFSLEFDQMHNITRNLHFKRTNFTNTCPFYKFISNNPRWNMERRTVNLFLRNLIGDDHFEW